MDIIAVVNPKGGSGRTTLAVNLAAALAEAGRRPLVVDLDPQGSASAWLGAASSGRELLEALLDSLDPSPLVESTGTGIALLPGGPAIAHLELHAPEEPGPEALLRTVLARLDPDRRDIVLVDTPAGLGLPVINALTAAAAAIVPVPAHALSLEPLGGLVETMCRVRQRLNPALHLSGLVPCRVDRRTGSCARIVDLLRDRFGDSVYETVISEAVRVAEAPARHVSVLAHDPRGRAAREFRALAAELERRSSVQAPHPDFRVYSPAP